MKALICLFCIACDPYPNPTPNGLQCDVKWEWCVTVDGGIVGAP